MSKLLDQTCPHCAITEAAGAYCTRCTRRTEPAWLHAPKRSDAQTATLGRLTASRPKGIGAGTGCEDGSGCRPGDPASVFAIGSDGDG